MMTDLETAKKIMKDEGYTCVILNGGDIYVSNKRGVSFLLSLYEDKKELSNYSASDKVVGRGAAFLYALLNIKEVYADVLSKGAAEILEKYAIPYSYTTLCDYIINRTGDGICPIEEAVLDTEDKLIGLEKIKARLQELQK